MPGGKSYGRGHHNGEKILKGVAIFTNLAYLVRAEHGFVSFLDVQNAFQKIYKRQLTNDEKKSYFGRDNINEILTMFCSREFELKGDCTGRTIPEVKLRHPYAQLREEHKNEFRRMGLDPEIWMPHDEGKKKGGHARKPEPAFGSAQVPERRDSHRSTESRDFQRTNSQSSFNSFRENAPSYRQTNINERFKPAPEVCADPVREPRQGPSPRFSPRKSPENDFAPGVPQPIRAAAAKYTSQQSLSNHEQSSSNGVGKHQSMFSGPASGEEFEEKNNPRNLRGEKSVTWDNADRQRQSTSGRPAMPQNQQQAPRAYENGWEPRNSNMGFGRQNSGSDGEHQGRFNNESSRRFANGQNWSNSECGLQNSGSGNEKSQNIARKDQRFQRDVFDESDSNTDEPQGRFNNESSRRFANGQNWSNGQCGRQNSGSGGERSQNIGRKDQRFQRDVFDESDSNTDEPKGRFSNQSSRDSGNGRNSSNSEYGRQNSGGSGNNRAPKAPRDVFDDTNSNTDEPKGRFNNQNSRRFANGQNWSNGQCGRQNSESDREKSQNMARKDQRFQRDVFDESDSNADEPQGRFNNQNSRRFANGQNWSNGKYGRQNSGSGSEKSQNMERKDQRFQRDVFDESDSNTDEPKGRFSNQSSRDSGHGRNSSSSEYGRQNFGGSGINRAPKAPRDVLDDTSSNSTLEEPRQAEPQRFRDAGSSRAQMNLRGSSTSNPTVTPNRSQRLSDFITASVRMHEGVELHTVLGFVEVLDPLYEEIFGESTVLDFIEKHCRQVVMTPCKGKMHLSLRP